MPRRASRNAEGEFVAEMPKTLRRTRDLLVAAFEGGSNYWYTIEKAHYPPGTTAADFKEGGRMQPEDYYHWSQLVPTVSGGSLEITAEDMDGVYKLDKKALARGWRLLRQQHPKIYWRIFKEDDFDAGDADVFLQLALFGEVVFG